MFCATEVLKKEILAQLKMNGWAILPISSNLIPRSRYIKGADWDEEWKVLTYVRTMDGWEEGWKKEYGSILTYAPGEDGWKKKWEKLRELL